MQSLRNSIIRVISEYCVVRRGQPSDDAATFRTAVMNQYLDNSRNSQLRRATLDATLRGDWRNHDCIEVFIGWGHHADLRTIIEHLAWDIMYALAPRAPRVFSRKSWTG
eukprot:7953094-Pyramimonas_sp.AAC.1